MQGKKSVQFLLKVSQRRKWAHSLSLYIAEHTRLVPETEQLSAANQNRV